MNDERAIFLHRAPELTELAVRTAFGDALRARGATPGPVDVRTFGNRALAVLRAALQRADFRFDALAVHEVEATTVAAAARFLASPLARRLFALPPPDVRPGAAEIDAVVTARSALHVVRLECCRDDPARVLVAELVAATSARGEAPAARVHLFSLRDGRLRAFLANAPQQRSEPA